MSEQGSIFIALGELASQGGSGALCTIVNSQGSTPRRVSSKMLVYPDGSTLGTIGGGEMESRVIAAALESIVSGRPKILRYEMTNPERGDPGVCGGQLEVFVDPIKPPRTIVVVGGGHVGRAVAYLAHFSGYRVVVSDDRAEFCTPEAVPDADAYYPVPLADLVDHLEVTTETSFVLCTRNVEVDIQGLPAILETDAGYIGIIGSRRRWETTRQKLTEKGIPADRLNRVTSPMGLEINAETPEEIAVSILAEIIMLERGGHGRPMAVGGEKPQPHAP